MIYTVLCSIMSEAIMHYAYVCNGFYTVMIK